MIAFYSVAGMDSATSSWRTSTIPMMPSAASSGRRHRCLMVLDPQPATQSEIIFSVGLVQVRFPILHKNKFNGADGLRA